MGKLKVPNVVKDYISDRTDEGLDFLETIKPPKTEMERRMYDASKEAEKRLGIPHPNTPQQRIDAMNIDTNLWHGTPDKDKFIIPGLEKTTEQVGDNITTKIKWKQPLHTDNPNKSIYLSPQENFASVFTNDIKGINPGGADAEAFLKAGDESFYRLNNEKSGIILPLAGKIDDNVFDYTTHKGQQTIDEFLASLPDDTYSRDMVDLLRTGDFHMVEEDNFLNFIDESDFMNMGARPKEFYVSEVPYNDLGGERLYNELSGLTKPGKAYPDAIDKNVRLNFGNVRAKGAAFNPKYLGVGPGSILAQDLFAGENPNMDNSIRKNLVKTLADKQMKSDIKEYEEFIPAIPTNEAMMNFLELVGL